MVILELTSTHVRIILDALDKASQEWMAISSAPYALSNDIRSEFKRKSEEASQMAQFLRKVK